MSIQHPICIIPARSGSKGLRNKNMLFLAGKPLILHTIDAAIESGVFRNEDIYVSTDSIEYKEIIEELRPIKVILRREELASDTATTFDMLEDFLKDFPDEIEFMLCQPTSPLRSGITIKNAYETYQSKKCSHLVSFSESDKSLRLFSTIDENGCAKDVIGIDRGYRRQKQEKHYYPNGALFMSRKNVYVENKSFFTEETFAYVMNKQESIDVDDKYDFINVIGTKYFNYQTREQNNKEFYANKFKTFGEEPLLNKLIIGDSRMEQIQIEGVSNISVGGITLHTVCENIDNILVKDFDKVLIALGVNDLITGYSIESIKQKFEELVDKLILKGIKVAISSIIYTVFRYEVQNEDIVVLNEFISELAKTKGIELLDPSKLVCKNNQLEFRYTSDGLHMNERANELLRGFYSELLRD